jgi:hypothetical protein
VTEDLTLGVDTNGITDGNGLTSPVYSYQWLREGADIAGATGNTYTLDDADVGKLIRVRVNFSDDASFSESLTSAPTAPVENVNDLLLGSVAISGSVIEHQLLTALPEVTDADGIGSFGYQWLRNGVTIGGATAATYLLDDDDVGNSISVSVSHLDGNGTTEFLASGGTSPVINVNDNPQGEITIGGSRVIGNVITALSSLTDADGMGSLTYQWQREGQAISGATAENYLLTPADGGARIGVLVTYVDGHGTIETVASIPTLPIGTTNSPAQGNAVIFGSAVENQTLSVDTSSITDANGGNSPFRGAWRAPGTRVVVENAGYVRRAIIRACSGETA